MKKIHSWMLTSCRACSRSTKRASSLCARSIAAFAAILICGASMFTSCSSNEDNSVVPVEPDLNVAEKIIGRWMIAERNGQPETTNQKQVFNFTSATKVFVSLSIAAKPGMPSSWVDNLESEVAINRELSAKGIFFPFYLEYEDIIPDTATLVDKTMLEYRTTPGTKCTVHYRLAGDEEEEYHSLSMQEMYDGIYVTAFVLFFGEQLQYYITEEKADGEDALTESGTIQKSDIVKNQSSSSKYNLINDIMIGETLQDYDTVDKLLLEYHRKNFICNKMFAPLRDEVEQE